MHNIQTQKKIPTHTYIEYTHTQTYMHTQKQTNTHTIYKYITNKREHKHTNI